MKIYIRNYLFYPLISKSILLLRRRNNEKIPQDAQDDIRRTGKMCIRDSLDGAFGDHRAFGGQLPAERNKFPGVQEIHLALQTGLHSVCRDRNKACPDGAHNVAELQKAGVRCPIRIHKAIHTVIAVVGELAGIAAVAVNGLAFLCDAGIDGMVTPFPHKAAGVAVVFLHSSVIGFQIPGAVAHGVGIFTLDKGFIAVSYTHLDVYKRQGVFRGLPDSFIPLFFCGLRNQEAGIRVSIPL